MYVCVSSCRFDQPPLNYETNSMNLCFQRAYVDDFQHIEIHIHTHVYVFIYVTPKRNIIVVELKNFATDALTEC